MTFERSIIDWHHVCLDTTREIAIWISVKFVWDFPTKWRNFGRVKISIGNIYNVPTDANHRGKAQMLKKARFQICWWKIDAGKYFRFSKRVHEPKYKKVVGDNINNIASAYRCVVCVSVSSQEGTRKIVNRMCYVWKSISPCVRVCVYTPLCIV